MSFSSQTSIPATPDSAYREERQIGHLFPVLSVTIDQSGSIKLSSYDHMRPAISLPSRVWLQPYLIALYFVFADY